MPSVRAQEAHARGRPIAKPLVFAFPDDPRVKAMWQEFLYGDDILVAPVWKSGARAPVPALAGIALVRTQRIESGRTSRRDV